MIHGPTAADGPPHRLSVSDVRGYVFDFRAATVRERNATTVEHTDPLASIHE
jgi:hypothetical protein